jgi:dTDP-4-dehydrorhamnose reductase
MRNVGMKVLVISANGQWGWELVRRGAPMGLSMVGVDLYELDNAGPNSLKYKK